MPITTIGWVSVGVDLAASGGGSRLAAGTTKKDADPRPLVSVYAAAVDRLLREFYRLPI